jgi:hypothetical protein
MRARIVRSTIMNGDGVPHTNGLQFALCRVSAFLLDWTVPDESGAIVPIRDLPAADLEAVLDNLEPDAFADIHNAIEAHEAAMANERAEQKKTAGATPSAPISPSPAAVAGDTNG